MRDRIAIDVAAPMPFTGIVSCVVDDADTKHISDMASLLGALRVHTFDVPIGLFVGSYYRTRPVDSGVDLVVAIEAMFSEGAESIAYKIAFRVACTLETDGKERRKLFRFLKTAYTHRNTLVHGSSSRPKATDWFAANEDELRGITRRSLLFLLRRLHDGVTLTPQRIDDWLFKSGRMDAAPLAGDGDDDALVGKCFDVRSLG